MKKSILLLGAGRVGEAIIYSLQNDFEVTVADHNEARLHTLGAKYKIETQIADLSDPSAIQELIGHADIVVGAVPGFMGYKVAESVIAAGKDYVDISFFPEDPFALDQIAKEKRVTAIVDIGVAPGLDNMVLGHYDRQWQVENFKCMVGGLPKNPEPPFNYKAPFSPIDVIEEYLRPARLKEDGKVISKPAMTDIEKVNFEKLGILEAFNTDGLRTLLQTFPHIPNMAEKTLRFPKHVDYIELLKKAGFFDDVTVKIRDAELKPIEMTAHLLFDQWFLRDGEPEFTIMRIEISGNMEGVKQKVLFELYDEYDPETGLSSMARTTGFTCAATVKLLAEKKIKQHGVIPPEVLGQDEYCYNFALSYLKKEGINIQLK